MKQPNSMQLSIKLIQISILCADFFNSEKGFIIFDKYYEYAFNLIFTELLCDCFNSY